MTNAFDRLIIGFDGSEQADDAVALGRMLGPLASNGTIVAYITAHQPPFVRQERVYAQARHGRVHEVLEPAVSALSGQDGVESVWMDSSSPARGLHDLASEYGGESVLVIGSTHRGPVGKVLLGSVGETLVSGGPCPIVVAPRAFAKRSQDSIANVAVGFDGSPESRAALDTSHRLASATGAKLRAIAVAHRPLLRRPRHEPEPAEYRDALEAHLGDALGELGGEVDGIVLDGDPAECLAEAAAAVDLLVLGGRGYGPRRHVLVGSVSSKLMRSSPSPVLVLPRPAADAA